MTEQTLAIRVVDSLERVDRVAWDNCANPQPRALVDPLREKYNPFVSHAFLVALERSESVGGRSGWAPAHILVENVAGRLVAAAPTYLKSHSLGEYVFDSGWAEYYQRAGGRYYPKIQVATPFTPVGGPRLLLSPDAPEEAAEALLAGLRALRERSGSSSVHITFVEESQSRRLKQAGFLLRSGQQFHFFNEGYRDFDDFLEALSSRKRKSIRRERREALGDDIEIDLLRGSDIKPPHWDAFFSFYMETGSRKWGRPYLTRAFFDHIGAMMADRILLVMARRRGEYIAGAINFLGDDAIYGRNWGTLEQRPFLHFEVCYYQAIDYAIRNGYRRVEAGAQGEHKLARGYRSVMTFSAHEFADARFGAAVADFLIRERQAVEQSIAESETALPFRRAPN